MTFNLVDKKWIPVLYRDGRADRVGIREALADASIREIRDSSPLVTFGIYRLLIAVRKWLGQIAGDRDWATALDQPEFADLFDVFNQPHPFLQHAEAFAKLQALVGAARDGELSEADKEENQVKTVAYLATEIPTGTYKAHFWHASDDSNQLCTRCCVYGLVVLSPFCTGVGQGNESSINNVPPVYWLIHGSHLSETIRLNTPDGDVVGDGPCWTQMQASDRVGPLEGLTWQPRSVALHAESGLDGRCSRCGETGGTTNPLVRWIIFKNRAPTKANDPRVATWVDPHVAGAVETRKGRTRFVGLGANGLPGAWCERVQALLRPSDDNKTRQAPNAAALAAGLNMPAHLEAVAYMLHSEKADFEHWQEERWPICPYLLTDAPLRRLFLASAEQVGAIIAFLLEEWPKRVWRLRYPERRPDKNAVKTWKKGHHAGAIYAAIKQFDHRLKNWYQEQMLTAQSASNTAGLMELPRVCRKVGHDAVADVVTSLAPAASPLEWARLERAAGELIEDAVDRAEQRLR